MHLSLIPLRADNNCNNTNDDDDDDDNNNNDNNNNNDDDDDDDDNNNNNNRIERCNSRFFNFSSLRRKLSPTRTLKWPGRNRVQIMCNTSSAYHANMSCYVPHGTKGQLSY